MVSKLKRDPFREIKERQLFERMSSQDVVMDGEPVQVKETRGKAKKRDASVDVVAAFDEKIRKVRSAMLELMEGLNDVRDWIMEVEGLLCEDFTTGINQATTPLHDKNEALKASIDGLNERIQVIEEVSPCRDGVEAMKAEIRELKTELALCKLSITNGAVPTQAVPKIEVPKPKEFKGNQSTQEVDNFVWSMEQ